MQIQSTILGLRVPALIKYLKVNWQVVPSYSNVNWRCDVGIFELLHMSHHFVCLLCVDSLDRREGCVGLLY